MRYRVQLSTFFCLAALLCGSALLFITKHSAIVAAEPADCGSAGASLRLGQPFAVSGYARSFVAGDFNQDGKPDLAVAASVVGDTGTVTILLGDGSGYLEAIAIIPLAGSLNELATGDFNRDGKLDLAVSGPPVGNTTGVASLLGNGDGTFRLIGTYAAGVGASAMAIGDFNGDGQSDIATVNRFDTNISVLRGNGNGSFAAAVPYTVGGPPSAIAAADLNGDGRPDLAVAGQTVVVLINNGTGGFNPPANLNVPGGGSAVAVGDFNGDSKPDLVVGQITSIAVFLGDGRGGFGTLKNFGNRTAASFVLRDFNGDGKVDLAFANSNVTNASVVIMLGAGNGDFGAATEFAGGKLPYVLATADFNQDGKADLAVLNVDQGNAGATQFSILLGNGMGGFQAPLVTSGGSFPASVSTADLNKDGKPDLIITNNSTLGVNIALNNGQGIFGAPLRLDNTYGILDDAAAAVARDFNRDGNVDLAVVNGNRFGQPPGQVAILQGRGDGTFDRTRSRVFTVGSNPADIVAADFNGDGDPDIATANALSNDVSLLLSNGSGGFGTTQNLPVGLEPRSLVTGDFNNDNKLDLVVANRNTATLTIMLGNGNGTFNSAPLGIGANPRVVKTGDVNNDGKADLIVPHNNAAFVSVLLGNGNGTFSAPLNSGLGRLPFAIVVSDFNGDGKLDVAATVFLESDFTLDKVRFFAGDGAGRFSARGDFTMPLPTHLAATDFNGDGLADLVALTASQGGTAAAWIVLNQCNVLGAATLTNTSAASFRRLNLASEAIIAAFGSGLSPATAAATALPLPTQLAGTTVKVKDSLGNERAAPLFFVSPGQINYLMPTGTASGLATVTVTNGNTSAATGTVSVAPVAPGLFTANANGQGAAAGVALRVKPNGTQVFEPLAQFDAAQNQFVPAAIDVYGVNPPNINDQVFLILFGTGVRGRSAQANVQARVGGVEVPVFFAGAQGQLAGLDQINLALPKSLNQSGELDVRLTVDGKITNEIRIKIR